MATLPIPSTSGTRRAPEAYAVANYTSSMIQENRDYFVNKGPKPGYSPYLYPHPLRSGGASTPATPAAPTNLRITHRKAARATEVAPGSIRLCFPRAAAELGKTDSRSLAADRQFRSQSGARNQQSPWCRNPQEIRRPWLLQVWLAFCLIVQTLN